MGGSMEAGWQPDPYGRHHHRYWDGRAWTSHVADDGVAGTDVVGPFPPPQVVAKAPDDAETRFAALREADARGDAEASVQLGQALRNTGQFDLAREAFERGEARGHKEAAGCLGNMLSDAGDTVGARAAYERGVAAGSEIATLNLGLMLAQEGEVDDALRFLAMARDNGDPEAHWAIGKLLEGRGDVAGATASYRAGAAMGFAPAAFELGIVLYEAEDFAGAEAAWKRADELGDERAKGILETLATAAQPTPVVDHALANQLVHRLAAACSEVMRLYDSCSDEHLMALKGYHVAAQPQHPTSRESFLRMARESEQNVIATLSQLAVAQQSAKELRGQFLFVSGVPDGAIGELLTPLVMQKELSAEEVSSIMVGGIISVTDFGLSFDGFAEASDRLQELFKAHGMS